MSHIRYCLPVFGNGTLNNMKRLQKIQNFALRVISGRRKSDHISDVRDVLGWPTVQRMYEEQSLNSLHKITSTQVPESIASQLQTNSVMRARSTRQDRNLALPRVWNDAGKRRFVYRTAKAYNKLPGKLRMSSIASFKRGLKSLRVKKQR